MPKRVVLTMLGLFVAASLLAVVALGGLWLATRILEAPGRPDCSAAEEAFAENLGKDPMVNRAPAGLEKVWADYAEPCESLAASDWYGGAETAWGYSAGNRPSVEEIVRFYRELAVQQGWRMERGAGEVERADQMGIWIQTMDNTTLSFSLHADRLEGRDVYWARITYDGIGTQR
ncbi:hypothetical protein [Micromonospora sp. NPDC051296]|uniref:hypothetical protein n=1 Tax=Micromonospora sp. NPDC051296 TaxID=3155046 RepID=UPI00341D5A5A